MGTQPDDDAAVAVGARPTRLERVAPALRLFVVCDPVTARPPER